MQVIPETTFKIRRDEAFDTVSSVELFDNKKVVIFSLPGAFTPTCSAYQLPGYEEKYDEFIAAGVDDVYCISVNDGFVMNAWAKDQGIEKVKMIPDGNADFTREMGMLVSKSNLGFGNRSWRYAMVVTNLKIEKLWEEPGKSDNLFKDPYEVSDPETVLTYLKSNA